MFVKFFVLLFVVTCCFCNFSAAQTCTLPGMTPDKAFPVCGTSVFHQSLVTSCTGPSVFQSDCSVGITSDKSFWYKFTCFQTGTLGFLISGISNVDDYDWVLFDVTGRNPLDVFSSDLHVSINIYGTLGNGSGAPFPNSPTGCTPSGSGDVHCDGDASGNSPFNRMPVITVGHDYLLMVTNWTSGSNIGYDLTFSGGTASITDPKEPHLLAAKAPCDGTLTTIKLNKKMKCKSLLADGSEFTLTPPLANIIAANGVGCSSSFDMDSLHLTLDAPLPPGNYTITIRTGADGTTLTDNCDRNIPNGESIPVTIYPVVPTPMDSISKVFCAPTELQLVFDYKKIRCNSIAADGSDFRVTGPTPVTVTAAAGICDSDGLASKIIVKLAAPIQTKGIYTITLFTGSDGNTLINECDKETLAGANLPFATKDTVNANFSYYIKYGCKRDTIVYAHDGRNEVNSWKWDFDKLRKSTLQNPSIVYGTFGIKYTQLIVSNGVCTDTSAIIPINLDNELKAKFEATSVVCPGDLATFKNNSIGNVKFWFWDFANTHTSILKDPLPQTYPASPYTNDVLVKLIATDNYGCKDSAYQKIKVAGNCYIAVPNAFTPNQDGLNDYLYPTSAYKATNLLFRIYNRFGELVYQTKDWTKGWDGTYKGQAADAATYVWTLTYTNTDTKKYVEQKGTSILLR